MSYFHVGVDIGQRVDHSAVCVVEDKQGTYIVRFIWKYPLGTPYPMLVKTLAELSSSIRKKGEIMSFVVDATGSGQYPAQMIQDAITDVRVSPYVFTNKLKRELVGKVKVMHSFGKLKFARRKGDEVYNTMLDQLIREMRQVQAKVIREDVNQPEIEVFSTGTHDDMFTALALAVHPILWNAPSDAASAIQFVEDKSWVNTPLTDKTQYPDRIFYFTNE